MESCFICEGVIKKKLAFLTDASARALPHPLLSPAVSCINIKYIFFKQERLEMDKFERKKTTW